MQERYYSINLTSAGAYIHKSLSMDIEKQVEITRQIKKLNFVIMDGPGA